MSAINNHFRDEFQDRYANRHMPILAGEAAVMRPRSPRRRVPIGISFPLACMIGWGLVFGVVGVMALVVSAVSALWGQPMLALALFTLAAGAAQAGRLILNRRKS